MKTFMLSMFAVAVVCGCESTVVNLQPDNDVVDVAQATDSTNVDAKNTTPDTSVDVKQCLTVTIYHDADKDGWGDKATAILHCADQPLASDWTLTLGDCDDKNSSVHSGAVETCNNIDDNCNGETDEACIPAISEDADAGSTDAGSDSSDADTIDAGSDSSTDASPLDAGIDSGSVDASSTDNATDSSTDAGSVDIGSDVTSAVDASSDSSDTDSAQTDIGSVDAGSDATSSVDSGTDVAGTCIPTTELCDGIDNNCNGVTDEGFAPGCGKLMPKDGDPMSCSLLGGKSNLGKCENFCNSCSTGMFCEDTNMDGHGDKCSSIPPDSLKQIPPYYKDGTVDIENIIIVAFEGLPKPANFWESFQTYTNTSQIGWGWTDEFQWQMNSTWLVMQLSWINGIAKQGEGFDNPSVCGIRFNLGIDFNMDDGKPASNWLCEGNGSTAQLMFKPRFFIIREGVGIEVTKLVTPWSAPNGAGCSALLPIKTMCPD